MTIILLEAVIVSTSDPITAILSRDWAALGGWSLLVGTWMVIVTGSFREWWVPGVRYRRLETASQAMIEANDELRKQNGQLITSNQIVKHFFEETVPKRGELRDVSEKDS